ncbi:MFS transporter [Nocardioides sp. DS6]|uniref:MFS transporter n=1 Tax=Nocardioides eburneus TaxID=3231482 RepID=A0ABV3SZB4_9ACTN
MNRRTTSAAFLLAGILLLALNLRPAAVSVGPVLPELRRGLTMSTGTAAVLTTLPVLAFAVFGALAPVISRLFGIHRATLLALFAIAIGLFSRALASDDAVFLGLSALALAGMAVANVLLPSLVKRHFPRGLGPVTALYSTVQAIGMTLALVLTVPIAHARGGWRTGLAVWGVLALVAALPWLGLVRHDHAAPPPVKRVRFIDVARTRLGLAMAGFFGLQALQSYAVFGWFATLWRDHGFSAGQAGLLVGLVAAVSVPLSLFVPAVAAWARDPRPIMAGVSCCFPLGYVGLLVAPHALAIPGALLLGVGTVSFPLALVLIGLRTRLPDVTAALSAVTQAGGYTLAVVGPLGFGLLHAATGGWTWPLVALALLGIPQLLLVLYVGRPGHVDDRLPASAATAP